MQARVKDLAAADILNLNQKVPCVYQFRHPGVAKLPDSTHVGPLLRAYAV